MGTKAKLATGLGLFLALAEGWLQVSSYHSGVLAWVLGVGTLIALGYSAVIWWQSRKQRAAPLPEETFRGTRIGRIHTFDNGGAGIRVGRGAIVQIENATLERNKGGGLVVEGTRVTGLRLPFT